MKFAQLENFVFEKMAQTKLPGVSGAIVKGEEIVWVRGFGLRDLEHGLPATPQTLYSIGSLTKSFTAVSIMQLAEQGKLSLDDPVSSYLPFNITPHGEPIRIWHLLTHSSGIPALAYAENVIGGVTGAGGKWLPIANVDDMLTFLADAGDWVLAKPGERWFYLNEGYILLSGIIEKVSGLPYRDYVAQRIFAPLGMTRSFFHKADIDADADAAVPYVTTQEGKRLPSTYPYAISGDGGIISNVLDLAKYVQIYLRGGEGENGRFLSPESITAMQTPRIPHPMQDNPFGPFAYGYGLGILPNFLGETLVAHSGSVGTATAFMGFLPARQLGILLLANGSGYPLGSMGQYGLALMLGHDPEQLPVVQRQRRLSELAGEYTTYKGTMRRTVRKSGDFLLLEAKDNHGTVAQTLVPDKLGETRRTFFALADGIKQPVEFRVSVNGIELIVERYYLRNFKNADSS